MFEIKILLVFFFLLKAINIYNNDLENVDLSIVGYILSSDGIGRMPITLIDSLKDNLNINFISSRSMNLIAPETPHELKEIIKKKNDIPGNLALFTDILASKESVRYESIPEESIIKIAYSMIEGSVVPHEWIEALNLKFDAVVVPDSWLINVYKKSGLKIPIFVLPLILNIEDFLKVPPKTNPNKPFVFGNTMAFIQRKNHIRLVQAFAKVFKNLSNVKLYISGRMTEGSLKLLKDKIKELDLKNVILKLQLISQKKYILI